MTFFSTSDRLEIGDVPFISHGNKPTRREALEYYRRVAGSWNLNIQTYEKVLSVDGEKDKLMVKTSLDEYMSRRLIVATGYYDNPNLLNVTGETKNHVKHYYDEPHPYANKKVVVVGAGNSAVDVALELFRVGAEVTMVIRESKLKEGIKYWVKPDIENRIKEGSIKAHFNSEIREITESSVQLQKPKSMEIIACDFVFAMTGYHPDFGFLKGLEIQLENDDLLTPIFNSRTFETSRPGVYLAGVVCGGMETSKLFIENSREHSEAIFNDILQSFNKS
jgi:thioredoxin reductase (NADPH)